MSEIAHTPGPWVIRKDGDSWLVTNSEGAAFVLSRQTEAGAIMARNIENANWRTNKVRDAASDMLAALKAAVAPHCIGHAGSAQRFFRDNGKSREALELIFAAIEKAEGRS